MKQYALLTAVALVGCQQASDDHEGLSQNTSMEECGFLPKLNIASAQEDARAAWRRDERHYIGVFGFTRQTPGIEQPTLPIQMIEATSDSHCLEENEAIRRYATIYNREIAAASANK